MRHFQKLLLIGFVCACMAPAITATEPGSTRQIPTSSDLGLIADVDLIHLPFDGGSGDVALLVGQTGIQLLTLDPSTGNQLGRGLMVAYPPDPGFPPSPVIGTFSKFVTPNTIVILNGDYSMFWLPITLDPDGSPMAGEWQITPSLGGGSLGTGAAAMAEMPGSSFRDGLPRLFIGNVEGAIVRVQMPNPGPPEIDATINLLSGQPIRALSPIPQVGGLALGAVTSDGIFGLTEDAGVYSVAFERTLPPNPCVGVGVFESIEFPPSPIDPIHLAFSDGIEKGLILAELPSDASGVEPLAFLSNPGPPGMPSPGQFALGSLLYVAADSQGVYYDPTFGYQTGFGNCLVDLTGGSWGGCVCCFGNTGNVDCDQAGSIDVGDLTAMIDNLFISFAPLCCAEAANCDGHGGTDVGDLTALIDNLFITFAPLAACQ